MCVILATNRKSKLPNAATRAQCWARNPDGAGVMWAHNGKLLISKGHMTNDAFEAALRMVPATAPCVLHYRWATHGGKNKENTHPFTVKVGELALVHNGVMHSLPAEEKVSDTGVFVRDFAAHLDPLAWRDPATLAVLAALIGPGNKLVLLEKTGAIHFVNKSAGTEEDGVWYSNMYWRPTAAYEYAEQQSILSPCPPRRFPRVVTPPPAAGDCERDAAAVDSRPGALVWGRWDQKLGVWMVEHRGTRFCRASGRDDWEEYAPR